MVFLNFISYLESASVFPLAANLQAANHSAYCCSCFFSVKYHFLGYFHHFHYNHFKNTAVFSVIFKILTISIISIEKYTIKRTHRVKPEVHLGHALSTGNLQLQLILAGGEVDGWRHLGS